MTVTTTGSAFRVTSIPADVLDRIRAARHDDFGTGSYPAGYRDWPTMVFRPYRYDGVIAYDAIQMSDAESAEALIADIFADPTIEFIHTRNVYAGCFMFRISRPHGSTPLS